MATTEVAQRVLPEELRQPLVLDVGEVKGALVATSADQGVPGVPPEGSELRIKAKDVVGRLVTIPPEQYEEARQAVDMAGGQAVQVASHQSEMLRGKLGPLMKASGEGGPIAEALIQLRDQVSVLDPAGVNFTPGWFSRNSMVLPGGVVLAGGLASTVMPVIGVPVMLIGVGGTVYAYYRGNPLKNYFNKYETGQGAINSVIKSLENGKATLTNNSRILSVDQAVWRQNTRILRRQIEYLKAIDTELESQIPGSTDEDHRTFLREEILFPLRQRVQDLLQRLAINQQGVLVSEVLIRNNRELIRGIGRAMFVTVDALNIAVTAAMALADQELVLTSVEALNTATDTLIAGTAQRLRQQGVAIHKQASGTMLASNVLLKAFGDLKGAVEDVSTYRQEALPKMAQQILELDEASRVAEKAIVKMEQGNKVRSSGELDLDLPIPEAA